MAFSRTTSFAGETFLSRNELDSEFNNVANYLNTRVLTSPLSQDLDFGFSYTIQNLRKFWTIRNAVEFGGYTSTAIQAAIDDAEAAGEQGIIFLQPGTYSCTRTITLKSGTYLVGTPLSILQRTSGTFVATNNSFILADTNVAGCGIKDLVINGASVANSAIGGLIGVNIRLATDILIQRVKTMSWGATADGVVSGNHGVSIGSASGLGQRVWINDCNFDLVMANSVNMIDCRGVWIVDNTITNSTTVGDHGISGWDQTSSRDVHVLGNRIFQGVSDGIRFGSTSAGSYTDAHGDVEIRGNIIREPAQYGIFLERMFRSVIADNSVIVTGNHGINMALGSELSVHGNEIYGAAGNVGAGFDGNAIRVTGVAALATSGISIQGNRCYSSHGNGIYATAGAGVTVKNLDILGNTSRDSGRGFTTRCAGIKVEAASGTLTDVTISGNRCFRDSAAAATDHDGVFLQGDSMILTSNNLRGSAQGSGVAINRSSVTNLEEGHNVES